MEPERCDACHAGLSFTLVHNLCQYESKQLIKLQEAPDNIPEGETPHAVSIFVESHWVDAVKPGDRCTLSGRYP